MPRELIDILVELSDKISGPSKKVSKSFQKMAQNSEKLAARMKFSSLALDKQRKLAVKHGMTIDGVGKGLRNMGWVLNKQGKLVDLNTGRLVDMNRGMIKLKGSTMRFRMELLSVMFGGMMLFRTFGGLIKQVLTLLGVQDVWSATVTDVLMPMLEPLSEVLMEISFYLMDADESTKKLIGSFVLLGAGFGLVLMLGGQFGLLIMGLIKLAAWWGLSISALFKILGVVFGGIILLVWGIIDIFRFWGKDWFKVAQGVGKAIMGIGLLLSLVLGPVGWAIAAVGLGIWAMAKYWDKLPAWFQKIIIKIGTFVYNFGKRIKEFFTHPIKFIKEEWQRFVGWLKDLLTFKWAGAIGRKFAGWFGGFQLGGIVPETGPYILHKGEVVTPAAMSPAVYSPTINVYASISSDYDVRKLATELSRYWMQDLARYSKVRG